jgi:alpha-N-arabinofuranosidase
MKTQTSMKKARRLAAALVTACAMLPGQTPAPGSALQASVVVNAGTIIRNIPGTLYGANVQWVWDGNGLWLNQQNQPDRALVSLTQNLGVSLIRYPGGVYSDYYHWKDGVGPDSARPLTLHDPASQDYSRPDFGTDEALEFASQVNGQLLITVNAGTGTAQEAADWVRYVNATSLRVLYWEVGNELYIKDGSPDSAPITVDPKTYAARFLQFAQAMRAVDPRIKIGAIGGENQGSYATVGYPNWDQIVLQNAGSQIDFIAIHNAYAPVIASDGQGLRSVYGAMLAAPVLIARNLQAVASDITQFAPAGAQSIAIAVTEWGPLFETNPAGSYVEHTKTLGSALYAASVMKAFIESPQTQIANFHVLNDYSIMGWSGSLNGSFPPAPDWAATARSYAFQLFTGHFGSSLVQSSVVSPTFNSDAAGLVAPVSDVPYLEVVSSLSSDGKTLYILGINKDFDSPVDATIAIQGFQPASAGTAWVLAGTGIDANTGTTPIQVPGVVWGTQAQDPQNPQFYNGGPGEVTLTSIPVQGLGSQFVYNFPRHSVTSIVLSAR